MEYRRFDRPRNIRRDSLSRAELNKRDRGDRRFLCRDLRQFSDSIVVVLRRQVAALEIVRILWKSLNDIDWR